MVIFNQKYDGESLYDLDRDIHEAFSKDFNPKMAEVPQDKHGFLQGSFIVTVEWKED